MTENKKITVEVNGVPVEEVIEKIENDEIDRERRQEIRSKSMGIGHQQATGKYANTSGSRTERRDYAHQVTISEERRASINFTEKYKGENKVADLLSITQTHEGPVETAMRETAEKLTVLRRQAQQIQLEITRYEAAQDKMQEALGFLTGKTQVDGGERTRTPGQAAPKGERVAQLKSILLSGARSRRDVLDQLVSMGVKRTTAYMVISSNLRTGKIKDENDLLHWIGN